MNEIGLPVKKDRVELTIPAFNSIPEIVLDVTCIKEGENRLVEAKIVNGATYNELEYVFNEGYREAKKHLSVIGYQITRAKKALRDARAEALIDRFGGFLKKQELKDTVSMRVLMKDAFIQTQPDYVAAQDRIDMLEAMEALIEGKIKVFENVCRYMRKQIDIDIRSGVINGNKYGSNG